MTKSSIALIEKMGSAGKRKAALVEEAEVC
jgi:hypothetical protein